MEMEVSDLTVREVLLGFNGRRVLGKSWVEAAAELEGHAVCGLKHAESLAEANRGLEFDGVA